MKVTQEKLPASQMGLEIEIPAEMSKQAYERTLQEFTRSANIPGFRKGKIPRHILLQRFGATRLKAAALEDLIQKALEEAIAQEKMEVLGNYQLRSELDQLIERYEPGQPLMISVAVDVPPEVSQIQYTGLTVQAEEVKYDPQQVEKALDNQRQRQATLIPVEGRPAQMGDVVLVDFVGRLTGEGDAEDQEIPGGKAENFELDLAEGRFVPGFVDGMVGMSAGETKEVPVEFPENYPQEELAGQPAIFTTTLKEIKEKELPELDDEFAQEVSEFETLAELRESLEKRYQEDANQKTQANKEEAFLKELIQHLEVDLPESLVREEVNAMLTETAMQLANQGLDVKQLFTAELIPQLRERSRPEAVTRLKRTLALQEIAKRESLTVEAEAIETKAEELLNRYRDQKDLDPDRVREVVEADLLKEKIMSWLEDHNTVELVPEGSLKAASDSETELEPETDNPPVEES